MTRWDALRDRLLGITQTEARKRLKEHMTGLPAPRPTRPGYDRPDGSERMVNPRVRNRWQDEANRILRGRKAS